MSRHWHFNTLYYWKKITKNISRIKKKIYVIGFIAAKAGCSVLKLPLYHCIMNPIKIVTCVTWMFIQVSHRKVDLIRKVFKESISTENWVNYTNLVIKAEARFCVIDRTLDNEIELFFPTCLQIVMSMIIVMKCNKYPAICKQFENILEILKINLINAIQFNQNLSISDNCSF